jgi:hypothetical protein
MISTASVASQEEELHAWLLPNEGLRFRALRSSRPPRTRPEPRCSASGAPFEVDLVGGSTAEHFMRAVAVAPESEPAAHYFFLMMPQATRPPAFPVGCVVKSSSFA